MLVVKEYSPFFDVVWCSAFDVEKVRKLFTVTDVQAKSYVPIGKAVLVKYEGEERAPGYKAHTTNRIVGTIKLGENE